MTDPVYLPDSPRARVLAPSYIDAGGVLRGSHGGASQPIGRLGDHWMFSVDLPVMKWEDDARLWIARMLEGTISKNVALPLFFPGFKIGVPGNPVVDGDVAGGSLLPIREATPHYTFRDLQFISVLRADGKRSTHSVTQTSVAEDGTATLAISPMLRRALADGDTVEVGQPYVQGYFAGDNLSWSIDEARTSGLSFQIEEA